MIIRIFIGFFSLIMLFACSGSPEEEKQTAAPQQIEKPASSQKINNPTNPVAVSEKTQPIKDIHSFANIQEVVAQHLNLDITVNFEKKQLEGFVELHIESKIPSLSTIILDTRDITIHSVEYQTPSTSWQPTSFKMGSTDPKLGTPLIIDYPKSKPTVIKVNYTTSPQASGLQWLTPNQTGGKKRPFLFSQAQAIHARSFIPLQDSPQVRTTYKAKVRTPKDMLAVMSAGNERNTPKDGEYDFEMSQAIPSYLIALAVGDLVYKPMGERTGVYAEPYILDASAKEFEDTEAMLIAVEEKFGTYRWEQYDLLILPPSFPFGGMENPRLSFITPTVIAGDKSLVALIAHELAHSWSGNLVTNATWGDLWLNEGFTTYLTYRIMEIIYGKQRFDMEAVLGYQDLQNDIARLPSMDQHLSIDLTGRDPDESFSNIPYEKGALFIRELEEAVGRDVFDQYLVDYFANFAFKSTSTQDFLDFTEERLVKAYPEKLSMNRIRAWIFEPGIPENHPIPSSNAFTIVDETRQKWLENQLQPNAFKAQNWTVHQWLYFLNNLPEQLSQEQLKALDDAFQLTQSQNNEIAHSWLKIAINNQYQVAYPRLESYLIEIGRRKLIQPLYAALVKTDEGKSFARRVYAIARPGYHPLAQGSMDAIINK